LRRLFLRARGGGGPGTVALIPGKAHLHFFEGETMSAAGNVELVGIHTKGFIELGQQELIIYFKKEPYLPQNLEQAVVFFKTILQLSNDGRTVSDGCFSQLGGNDSLGGYGGVLYTNLPDGAIELERDNRITYA
jgi:hypothetical protein